MFRLIASVFLMSMVFSVSVIAGPSLDKLNEFTKNLKTMSANFTQTAFDNRMQQQGVSKGIFYLQKPGMFRWDYKKPDEQIIVADGEKLWIYDIELEQITVRPLSEALGAAPIALLTNNKPLEDQFKIIELGLIDGRHTLQLEAKVKDTDYGFLLLALGKEGLEVMELKDKLGNFTRFEFEKQKINKKIDASKFKFTPPEGVDVM